jgi:hypothetical protein
MPRMTKQRTSHGAPVGAHRPSLLALLTGHELLRRRSDAHNVDRLRAQLGCSLEDARRVYALAREQGFGSAYETVFGAVPRQTPRPLPARATKDAGALRGLRSERKHRAQPS